jgi:hypothetical protein
MHVNICLHKNFHSLGLLKEKLLIDLSFYGAVFLSNRKDLRLQGVLVKRRGSNWPAGHRMDTTDVM